jgi:ABC-type branched-subunit amino acid transport system permease subunit
VGLAAVAGMIAAPISSVYPNMGSQVLIMCFVVVVIGGIGSVRGALISALLVGLVDTFGKVLLPSVAGMLVYMLMAAVLLWKPEGLFKSMSTAPKAHLEILPAACRLCWEPLGLMALLPFPRCLWHRLLHADGHAHDDPGDLCDEPGPAAGRHRAGLAGHAAYFGLAGYALAFLTPQGEAVSLWWTLPLAVLGSGVAALVIGFFVVRTHGIYFIMVTMAFAQMVFYLFFDNKALGGSDGLYINFKPTLHGLLGAALFDLDNKVVLYYLTLAPCCWSMPFPAPPAVEPVWPGAGGHPRQ